MPDLNFGTVNGGSCDPGLLAAVEAVATDSSGYSWVSNGRFKGGAITRMYGRPQAGVHAIQLELAQETYLQEAYPYQLCDERADAVRPLLRALVESTLDWVPPDTGRAGATQCSN